MFTISLFFVSLFSYTNTHKQTNKMSVQLSHPHGPTHTFMHSSVSSFAYNLLFPFFMTATHTLRKAEVGEEWPSLALRQREFYCNLAGNQEAAAGSEPCLSSPNAQSHSLPFLLDIKESFTKHLSFLKSHYAVLPCLIVSLLNLPSPEPA